MSDLKLPFSYNPRITQGSNSKLNTLLIYECHKFDSNLTSNIIYDSGIKIILQWIDSAFNYKMFKSLFLNV